MARRFDTRPSYRQEHPAFESVVMEVKGEDETFVAILRGPDELGRWTITIDRWDTDKQWRVKIPWRDYAVQRISELMDDSDVIDLLREWGEGDYDAIEYGSLV